MFLNLKKMFCIYLLLIVKTIIVSIPNYIMRRKTMIRIQNNAYLFCTFLYIFFITVNKMYLNIF